MSVRRAEIAHHHRLRRARPVGARQPFTQELRRESCFGKDRAHGSTITRGSRHPTTTLVQALPSRESQARVLCLGHAEAEVLELESGID